MKPPTPQSEEAKADIEALIDLARHDMEPETKEALRMVFLGGMKIGEAARLLGIPRQRVHAAYKGMLRRMHHRCPLCRQPLPGY